MRRSTAIFAALAFITGGCSTLPHASEQRGGADGERDDTYARGAVAADHRAASRAGVDMLRRGGNAVDAAVATSFTLSVVRPYSSGIGGGGFMVISFPDDDPDGQAQCIALNYREVAPSAVSADHYVGLPEDASRFGGHAVGVPGTVAGLLYALETYGTLDRASVLEPAIRAAEEGVAADENFVAAAGHLSRLRDEHPHLRELSQPIWERLCLNGEVKIGDVIRQPEKARTLRLIAERGAAGFYEGEVAEAIVETVRAHGGVMTHRDLASYAIDVTQPLRGSFRDLELLTMPPPSSGGVAIQQILGIVERRIDDLDSPSHDDATYVHLISEAMKHAFADRAEHLADPLFVDVPVRQLTSESYLDELAARFDPHRTLDDPFAYGSVTPEDSLAPSHQGGTSHFSVIDLSNGGMAVACTETVNLIYGSLVYVKEFGIVLNNQMDDFTTIPGAPNAFGLRQSDRNVPEPGKRPLSSMSPTIVLRDGTPMVIAGASGGPRIITATLQAMLNHILFEMHPAEAVGQARFHHQWMPNVLQLEERWHSATVIEALRELGHETSMRDEIGVVQMITIDEEGNIRAASDPRKGGRAAGW